PPLGPRDHVRASVEKTSQELLGRGRQFTEPTLLRMYVEPRGKQLEHPVAHEALREARRIRTPARQLPRAVDAAGLEVRLSGGGHGMMLSGENIQRGSRIARGASDKRIDIH